MPHPVATDTEKGRHRDRVPVRAARDRARASRLLPRPGERTEGDHRRSTPPPWARPSAAPASTPTPPPPTRCGRAQPLARDVLQGRARGARPRRRQGGHHRRPADRQDRGAAARLRPLRAVAQRSLLHRLRRRHLLRGHGPHRPRVPFVTGRTVAHGGAGDSSVLTAYGMFQGMRAAAEVTWGAPTLAGRTVGVAGIGKVGRHLVRHLIEDGATVIVTDVCAPAIERVRDEFPQVTVVDSTPRRWSPPSSTSTPRARSAAPSPTRSSRRSARRSSAVPPTTSSPTRASRSSSRTAASSTPPTTA